MSDRKHDTKFFDLMIKCFQQIKDFRYSNTWNSGSSPVQAIDLVKLQELINELIKMRDENKKLHEELIKKEIELDKMLSLIKTND